MSVRNEVWLIEPSFDTDLKMFGDIIRANLERGIKYRYLVPETKGILRQGKRFIEKIGGTLTERDRLEVRTTEPYLIESEVVIYDPYTEMEDVMLMSPREHEIVFWYRVGKKRGEDIRDRYDVLWENMSKAVTWDE